MSDHPKSSSLLADFPVVVEIPVQWGEMDAYAHVNNTAFFRYFETARIAFLGQCGFVESYEQDQIGAILHSTDCRFRRALQHPDTVMIGARVTEIGDDRFTMEYRVVSLSQEAVAADGSGVIVSFDYKAGKKTTIPPQVRARIEALREATADER